MQIKRLRLSGFKSFVDAADLRIEPGLTGVVGPNGCGKSNLLEALRWTMGENSPKSMRGAGMEDVIFAGTATRPPRDFAEVSLLAEIAGEETEVVRRIERGAGSAYRIDGRDVRAKDVALLFADAATGAHSPALVSQNRIGAVIAAKPAERRAMLEEAAGIAGLHVRRKDAEAKLRATEANLARLDEVIADQDARAAALKRQARQAERYRALSAQIRVAEARMIFARWREAAAAADTAKAEAASAGVKVTAAHEAQTAAAAYQAQATDALATARAAALSARDRASEAGHRLAALRSERDTAERRLRDLAEASARIVADRDREGALANDAADAIGRLTDEARLLEREIARGGDALPTLDAALAGAERSARDAEVALAQTIARAASEAADARVANAALNAARARLERAEREVAQVAQAIAAIGDPAPIEAERRRAIQDRDMGTVALDAARRYIADADAAERAAAAGRDTAQATRAAARADLSALESEAAALTRATQRSGRDRLLDHVRAAPGYERALAAALGDDLEIGIDPSADAHWAGASASGDAAVAGDPLSRHVSAPDVLGRRLAQIIVVDTDDGRALLPGQRIVTRGGAMRRWDGLVARTGGAAAAERLERMNRLAAIETALPAARDAVAQGDAALDEAERAIAAARTRAQAGRGAMAQAEAATRDARQREDRATAQIERLSGQRTDLDARAARAETEHDEAAREAGVATAAITALPDTTATAAAVEKAQRAADLQRTAVAQARTERAAIDRGLTAQRERLAGAQVEAKSWRARAGDAARRIADMDKRAEELAREASALADRPGVLDADIARIAADHETARGAADDLAAAERAAESTLRAAEDSARISGEALSQARELRAGAIARAEHQELRRVEMGRVSGERFECPAPVLPAKIGFDSDSVRAPAEESATHDRLTVDRERIGPVNLVAEQELAELETGALSNAAERDELGQAVNRLRGSIGTLNREGRQRLLAAFAAVNGHFQRLFATLFDGGQAHLELVDSDDPLEAGLEIMAQPPGKRLQSLTLLSGGEQALTAVALIFGLFLTNPAPICVLDEVDAPLDDANIERFCDLLDAMTVETHTRYLIVTHNAVTMSRMHRLFGVTMIERGVSRLVSVDLGGAERLIAAE
ncbi:Chromosome partition protein Smc [Sphingomonas sp. EC-HK361]|uniref:chromosome segregation protein SMC n=1 Tax=Sphingomonas sp. EC-HK361 TaxID=2038397 RepID=UPI001254670F|nr:chromosome segregation protein SMC [Sphingomonas sp. EC-HK361]VVS98273.1 Chromosome partition protein Smc [Sphingomonas sp. EC-HK361]